MGFTDPFNGKRAGVTSALSILVEAALALYRGDKKIGTLLLGAAALAYRWSLAGRIAEALIKFYQRIQ